MAFVQVTWTSDQAPLHINIDKIISVRTQGEHTVIGVTVPSDRHKPFEYYVMEPLKEVMGRISTALAYAPGR